MGFNIITTTVQVETFCLYGLTFSHNYGLEAQKRQTNNDDTRRYHYPEILCLKSCLDEHLSEA